MSPNTTTSSSLVTDVLIIGGGPSGMMSAIYLDKLGISSIVVERQVGISQHPKAHELNARSIEILLQLGFTMDELTQEASPHIDASRVVFGHTLTDKDELGRLDLYANGNGAKYKAHLAAPEQPYLNLSQNELEKIMRKHLASCRHCQLLSGHEWTSLQQTPQGVTSTIRDCQQHKNDSKDSQGNPSSTVIQSKYVICADGAGSRSQKALGISMLGDDKLEDVISVYFNLNVNLRDHVTTPAKLYWIMNPEAPGTFVAHHIEKNRWVYHFPIYMPYENKEDYIQNKDMLKQRIHTAIGSNFVHPDSPLKVEIHSVSHWRMTCQIASAFRQGRAFLVGDAAHRFPPTGGLGMNSGIGDAQNLCWKLAWVIKGIASEHLLDSYEMERRPVIELNSRESLRNFRKIWAVPRSMGLNPNMLPWKAIALNSGLFKALPKPWTDALLRMVHERLSKHITAIPQNPALHQKVNQAIQNQMGHFDRIGLDLGYTYTNGAISHDETTHPPPQAVSQYRPSIEVGVRFPHFWIVGEGPTNKTSSHDWLHPEAFTLLCNDEGHTWWLEQRLELSTATQSVIHVVNASQWLKHQPKDSLEQAFYDYREVPLLLIRPDGQVAWKSTSSQPNTAFKEVLKLLIQPDAAQYAVMGKTNPSRHKNRKTTMMFLMMLLPFIGFFCYLLRPVSNIPEPAEFTCLKMNQGRFMSRGSLPPPHNIYGMGLTYRKHLQETSTEFDPNVPPPIFKKKHQSLTSDGSEVQLPSTEEMIEATAELEEDVGEKLRADFAQLSPMLDYEVELGFVVLEDISPDDLSRDDFVPNIGFFIANDLSARSVGLLGEGTNIRYEYWGLSKSFPGFLPMSENIWVPDYPTSNSIPCITIETRVNGMARQSETTDNMIYTPLELLRFIHKQYYAPGRTSLQKGDMVLTGTPGGVAIATNRALVRLGNLLGFDRYKKLSIKLKGDLSSFLRQGDSVVVSGEGFESVGVEIIGTPVKRPVLGMDGNTEL